MSASLSSVQKQHLDALVDQAPPLTDQQRAALRPLLSGTIPAPAQLAEDAA